MPFFIRFIAMLGRCLNRLKRSTAFASSRFVARLALTAILIGLPGRARCDANSSVQSADQLTVIARGPDHKVWQKLTPYTNELGAVTYLTNFFTEMATGMHIFRNGEWKDANEMIQINADGNAAFGTNTAHQVGFAANLHVSGAIDVVMPSGQHLKSTVLGLSFDDPSTGKNSVIAELQDSIGQLAQTGNQVIYTNALVDSESTFFADVFYTHRKGSFEQDIILRQQPPSPSQFGMNLATTKLQVWTEFFGAPEPRITIHNRTVNGQLEARHTLQDEKLDFGTMRMGKGNAFALVGVTNAAEVTANGAVLVPVAKHWVHRNGRTFLVEEVPLDAIIPQLSALPPNTNTGPASSGGTQSFFRSLPAKQERQAKMSTQTVRLAETTAKKGFLLDYNLVNATKTDFTFQSDTTYYMSGECDFYGTTTLEGGTVIKCQTSGEATVVMDGEIKCLTASYRPAIFTCTNDNSVGVALASTHNPALSISTFLDVLEGGTLKNIRFSYAWNAISGGGTNIDISDCQFINCSHPITVNSDTTNLALRNVLITMNDSVNNSVNFCSCPAGAITLYSTTIHVYGEHVTADLGSQNLLTYFMSLSDPSHTSVVFTNSILIVPSLKANYFGTLENWITVGTNATLYATTKPADLFQSIGAGNYYLNVNSPYRLFGTTNINTNTLADIQRRTTYPPVWVSNLFTQDFVMGPEVPRDTNALLDLGYHYDPMDFLSASCDVSNCTLLMTNGVVIGYFNNTGLCLHRNAKLVSQGTPTQNNYLVNYRLVQEQATNIWGIYSPAAAIQNAVAMSCIGDGTTNFPNASLRFTSISVMNGASYLMYTEEGAEGLSSFNVRDSEFYGAGSRIFFDFTTNSPVMNFQNNLFHRPRMLAVESMGAVTTGNNLYYRVGADGVTFLYYGTGDSLSVHLNDAFDQSEIYMDGTLSHNAYLNNTTNDMDLEGSAVTGSATWSSGPLGFFYEGTGSLANAGSTTANLVGLYHYTTQTSEIKETNSTVDIGYHYIALDSHGQPVSTGGDGFADYLKDVNGNGVFDPAVDLGNWQTNFTCGDGIDDYVKYRLGQNPSICTILPDTSGTLYLQVYTPLK